VSGNNHEPQLWFIVGTGVAHKVKSTKNQPQFSQTMMVQYWLGKNKPKQAFTSTRNAFKTLPQNFKNKLFNGIFY